MLKLYTDKSFLNDSYRKRVFPLLFDLHFLKSETIQKYYQITDDINACDVVVFPIDYGSLSKFQEPFRKLLKDAKTSEKPIWLYTSGDFGFTVFIPNSFNFRLGGFHSNLNDNTYILPSFINDPLENLELQKISEIDKNDKPSIGFVGHAKGGTFKLLKEYLSHKKLRLIRLFKRVYSDVQPFYPSSTKRAFYLDKLKTDDRLSTNFIYRDKYRAGAVSKEDINQTSKEFYQNIHNNIYTFCMRGTGNFSVRFYETLAMGRIPILLDTDCRLPLHTEIDWSKHCLIVNEKNAAHIADEIVKFHNSKSNTEIKNIQKSNRLLWENYLSRDAYFMKVHDTFKRKNE